MAPVDPVCTGDMGHLAGRVAHAEPNNCHSLGIWGRYAAGGGAGCPVKKAPKEGGLEEDAMLLLLRSFLGATEVEEVHK